MSSKGEHIVYSRLAVGLAVVVLAGCGQRSFVTPTRDGALLVSGTSAHLNLGAQEEARLVKNANAYCERRGKSAVVMASSKSDATHGNLAAPGELARATVEFRCQ